MAYKLSQQAKEDLKRIYHYGFKNWGETQADAYYFTFFEKFDEITTNPLAFQAVDHIRAGYRRAVCGRDSIYFRVNVENDNKVIEIMAIIGQQDFL